MSLLIATPSFSTLLSGNLRWFDRALDWQIHHPLTAIPAEQFNDSSDDDIVGMRSHLRKRTYRVTLPLIAYALGLNIKQTEALSVLCSLGFCGVMLVHFRRIFADPLTGLYSAVSFACSGIG